MKLARPLVFAASALALFISACSQPADVQTPDLRPQFGTAYDDVAYDVALQNDFLYVSGSSGVDAFDFDDQVFLRRFGRDGRAIWSRTFDMGPCTTDDCIDAGRLVRTDGSGNAYLLAVSTQGEDFADVTSLIKYSPSGSRQWRRTLEDADAFSTTIAVTQGGETYVAASLEEPYLAKYASDGTRIWKKPRPAGYPSGLAVASDGSLYAATLTTLSKFSKDGTRLWLRSLPDGSYEGDVAVSGNTVYVASGIYQGTSLTSIALHKYDSQGTRQWQRNIFPVKQLDFGGIAADSQGGST